MSKYVTGQTVTLRATFRDIAGDLIDPSIVVLTVEDPDDNVDSPVPTNPSVGVYEHQLTLDEAGWWDFRYEGTTSEGTSVCEGTVCALASAMATT